VPGRRKAKKKYRVRARFADGDENISLETVEYRLLTQHAAMALSDDPELRLSGEAYLRQVAMLVAQSRSQSIGAKVGGASSATKRQSKTAEQTRSIRDASRCGLAPKQIAAKIGCSESTVSRALKNAPP
jgi:DNA-binding NarL/FixJ family response regulator